MLRTLEERDIRFVRLWFTDVLGYLKSVAIAPAELEGAFEEGIGFDGSSIEGFARVSESDTVARPDPSTFQVLPWTTSGGRPPLGADVLRHHHARRVAVLGGLPTCAAPPARQGQRPGLLLLRAPRDRVLPAAAGARRRLGADPCRQRRLLRPGRARRRAELPQARHRRAGADGHLGGVQPPRGRARPAGDRPALRRRAVHGRQRDDVPVRGQGGRARATASRRPSCPSRSPSTPARRCTPT